MSWPGTVLQRWGSDRLSQHKPDNNITTFYLTEVFQQDNQTTTWKPFTYFYRQKYLCFFSNQIRCRHIFLLCISASYQMYGVKLWADVPLSFHDDNPVTKGRSLWTLKWGLSSCLVLICMFRGEWWLYPTSLVLILICMFREWWFIILCPVHEVVTCVTYYQ